MGSFVYAPGCKVYIDTYKHGILDVSDDLISGGMQRRSDGVSQFQFNLNNARRKYDRVFMPNDRIVVMMKRVTWLQTYTGYLNELPMFSSWPRVVPITSSCSLKRLQYFFWDPTLAASKLLVQESLINDQSGQSAPDGGIAQVIRNLLEYVVDWSGARALKNPKLAGSKIHIGGIPKTWFDLAANLQSEIAANTEEAAALARQLLMDAGALGTVAGTSYDNGTPLGGNGSVPAGSYDGKVFDSEQASNATTIVRTLGEVGATPREIAMTLACAMQESSLRVIDKGDKAGPDSRGLYQQRANGAWGSYSDRMNPRISTLNFYNVLKTKDTASSPFWQPIYQTQRCADSVKTHYARWEKAAQAMLAVYNTKVSTLAGDPAYAGGSAPGATSGQGIVSGAALATFAQRLVASRTISYGHSTNGTEAVPSELDCSAFLRHVVYKTAGTLGGMPRKASDIVAWAQQAGGKTISVDQARTIPGAVIGVTSNGKASGVTHIEMSVGSNKRVGAHHSGAPASVKSIPQGYFNIAVLLPGVTYGGVTKGVYTSGGQSTHGSPNAVDRRSATGGSTAGSSGRAISDAERQQHYGTPGSLAERTSVKTPWGMTVQGVHTKIAGQFAAACEEARRTSSWVPAQIQCLPPNDASGLPRRPVRGRSEWSLHSYGLAFDIFDTLTPSDVWGPVDAPDEAFRAAFKRHGFRLGADYSGRKDYPHIEWAAAPPDGTGVAYISGDTSAAGGPPGPPLFIDAASAGTDVSTGLQSPSDEGSLFGNAPWINPDAMSESGLGETLRGVRALANDTAILEYIKNLCNSTLRSFCSAPNGDFIAWFPDYYGKWKTAAKMVLEPIEVKDFTVTWSDEHLVTHQFVSGALGLAGQTGGGASGSIILNRESGTIEAVEFMGATTFSGIVTIDQPGVMSLLFGHDASEEETIRFTRMIYERFGPRPMYTEIPNITGPRGEFFMAVFLFMQGWAYQFNANIDITFMPELYPGMLIQFPMYNFQAYVTAVNHTFDFTTGFGTTINIAAPSKIKDDGDSMFGLPIGPGDGSSNPLRNKLDQPGSSVAAKPVPAVAPRRTGVTKISSGGRGGV